MMNKEPISTQPEQPGVTFEELVKALLDHSKPLPPRYLYRLSDLGKEEIDKLSGVWEDINSQRRVRLIEDLETIADSNYMTSFEDIFKIGLTDSLPDVRQFSIRALWDYAEKPHIPIFLDILENDPDTEVKAQAANGLGHFIYMGEIEEIDEKTLKTITDRLIEIMSGDAHSSIRRRALQSLGFSSHPSVPEFIQDALQEDDEDWLTSVLIAIGRTVDKKYAPYVLEYLHHPNPRVRLEAAQTSGELSIPEAIPGLLQLLDDTNDQIRMAAIWSLSEIGGEESQSALETLLENEDEEELILELVEEALENLLFNEDLMNFDLLDFSENDLEPPPDIPPEKD